ncbi:MAG: HEPN domain-containing protein [Deltaproteobacteria bacterium]|nr:HEPN domain-containing protein [Deltaproteobacteria bacterium]
MNEKNKKLNIQDEWERALTVIKEARVLAGQHLPEGATSRAYYAAFHATQAVLLTEGLQPKTHQGALYLFNHHFVKRGFIEPEQSQILARAAKYREEADYRHTMIFSEGLAEETIREVSNFLKRMHVFLKQAGYDLPSPI